MKAHLEGDIFIAGYLLILGYKGKVYLRENGEIGLYITNYSWEYLQNDISSYHRNKERNKERIYKAARFILERGSELLNRQ